MTDQKKNGTMQKETLFAQAALIGGILLMLGLPWLLTQNWSGISFLETGPIGDTIGGITAPVSGLLGAYLVFLALKAQVKANEMVMGEFRLQKTEKKQENEKTNIQELIRIFDDGINDFYYSYSFGGFNSRTFEFHGPEGIRTFFRNYTEMSNNFNDDPASLPSYIRITGLLKIGKKICESIEDSIIDSKEKNFLIGLFLFHYSSKISSPIERYTKADESHVIRNSTKLLIEKIQDLYLKAEEINSKTFM